MSLDISLTITVEGKSEVFDGNITHNLNKMARAVNEDFYRALWRPEELGVDHACGLIEPLSLGLNLLKTNPDVYKKYTPANGWGTYEDLVNFSEKYLQKCCEYPFSEIFISR